MNTLNQKLVEKLRNGSMIFGSHVFCGAPILTEAMAQCGFDVLWLDMEHTGIGIESVVNNMIAARSGGTPAWVRIPWNDPVRAKPVLDMGADGIIFPYIRTAEEARLAVASCTYPPEGIRGYGPLRALDYGKISQADFVKTRFRDCLRIVQIEHVDAVRNLREIAAVEGIDAFIVGPNDLSASVGRIGEINHPELAQLYKQICVILTELGKPFGLSSGYNKAFLQKWVDMGATILFSGSDTAFVNDGAMQTLQQFRSDFSCPAAAPMHDPALLERHMQFTNPEYKLFAPKYIQSESDNVHLHVVEHPQFGGLMAFWTQSTWEGAGDNHAVMATSKDGGKTWTEPRFIVGARSIHDRNQAHWAFPAVSKSGRIYLFYYQETPYIDFSRMITGPFMCICSDDFGETWSSPAPVPLRVTKLDKNGQLQNNCTYQIPRRFCDGKYLFGYTKFTTRLTDDPKVTDTRLFFARLENLDEDPAPQDLKITNLPDDENGIQIPMENGVSSAEEPCIAQLPDGRLFCTMRTARGRVYYTVSDDLGHTWREPEVLRFDDGSEFLHPLSPCPIFRLEEEKYVLLYHGEEPEADVYFPRNPLRKIYGTYAAGAHQPIRFAAGTEEIYMQLPEPEARALGQFGLAMYSCHVKVDGRDILWYPDRKCFLLGKAL